MTEQHPIDGRPPQDPTTLLGVVQPNPVGSTTPQNFVTPRVDVLREAATLIEGDRQQDYGTPQVNFQRIADLWNTHFSALLADGKQFTPTDVAVAMTYLKLARMIQTPKRDSFVDAAGYIGLAYELSLDD